MKGKVLIIEDEVGMCRLLEAALLTSDFDVTFALSGTEGLARFSKENIDLAIIDARLADSHGADVAALIKQSTQPVPVVIITGDPSSIRSREFFDAILFKPIRMADLLAEIDRLLPPALS